MFQTKPDCASCCITGAQHCRNTACVTGSTTGGRVPASSRLPVVLKGRGGTTGRSHDTWQLWHVTCYMTQKETLLYHLDGHHEVLVVLKVPKGFVKVCHGHLKVKFWQPGSARSMTFPTGESWNGTSMILALLLASKAEKPQLSSRIPTKASLITGCAEAWLSETLLGPG